MISTGQAPQPCKVGSATGFFFKVNDRKFLVTNRHVIINEEDAHNPDKLVIRVHTDATSNIPNRDIDVPLYDSNGNRLWLQHNDPKIDVAVLEVDGLLQATDLIRFLEPGEFPPPTALIEIGSPVMVIGYPLGLYDTTHNLPITRSAVATVYGAHFDGNPLFLIDANLHEGTSGSPVIMNVFSDLSRPESPGGTTFHISSIYLLGVNSGPWLHGPSYGEMGLHAVWYPELISNIISQRNIDTI